MTLCECACSYVISWGNHTLHWQHISQSCHRPAHTQHAFIHTLKQGAVQCTVVFPLILKSPFIDFMTHLRGMTCNWKDTVLKEIEQNSIPYWSLYVMEKWFINFFFSAEPVFQPWYKCFKVISKAHNLKWIWKCFIKSNGNNKMVCFPYGF